MKKILFTLCMLTGVAYAQFTPMTARGYQYKSIKVDSALFIPTFCGVPTFTISGVKEGAIGLDSCNNRFYYYNPKTNVWSIITSGSGSSGVDSVTSTKLACLDIQKYWSGGTGIAYDTIALYDGILKSGLVTQTGVLTFEVTQYIYRLACELTKTPLDTTVSVSAADDSLLRIDYIGGNNLGQVQVLEGIPSEVATPPVYDQTLFIPFTQVFISSDTTYLIPIAPNLDGRYVKIAVRDTILAAKTMRDTLIIGPYPLASDNLIIKAGTPINQFAYAIDTVALKQVRANFWQYVIGTSGTTVPKYSMVFKSPYATPLALNANGDVTTGSGLIFKGVSTITSGSTITSVSNSATLKNRLTSTTGGLAANGINTQIDQSTSNSGVGAQSFVVRGDSYKPIITAFANGTISNSETLAIPSRQAVLDFNGRGNVPGQFRGEGKGVIFPRMNTAQRDGINKRLSGVSISNGGANINGRLVVTATTIGIPVLLQPTISSGVLTALTIIDGGSGYTSGGSFVFDTTGTGATVLPVATYTVTTDTIPTALMLYNTDSACYQSYTGSRWINMRDTAATGGGIGVQSVTGLNTDNTDALNPIVKISVDGTTITGLGTPASPLIAAGGGGTPTLQQVLNAGYELSGNSNIIGLGASSLLIDSFRNVTLQTRRIATGDERKISLRDGGIAFLAQNNLTSISHALEMSNTGILFVADDTVKVNFTNLPIKSTVPTYAAVMDGDTLKRYPFPAGGSGTVTNVSRTNGYGITASVANSTTTPNITIAVDSSVIYGVLRDSIASLQAQINSLYDSLAAAPSLVFDSADFTIVDDTVRLMASYTAGIDLSVSDFTITRVGNYKVISGSRTSSEEIYFPDPSLFDGQTITIWMPAATDPAYINSAVVPVDVLGNNIDRISEFQVIIFKSMFGNWVGGALSVVVQ